MAKRIESPSSINTFKQCKRKYYYQYVKKLPTSDNIHCVRGNIAHSVLEDFFDIDVSKLNEDNYQQNFQQAIQKLLMQHWKSYGERLNALNLSSDKLMFYFEETMMMLMNWTNHFIKRLNQQIKKNNVSLQQAFIELTPVRELEYKSEAYSVRGFIDAIHHFGDEVHIVDYKTNSRFDIKDSIKLQLGIYVLLYHEKHEKMPTKVGISFLRDKLKMMGVTEELLQNAKREIELIHAHTSITEEIKDYPKTITPLCKWSTGQCDFYDHCQPHG